MWRDIQKFGRDGCAHRVYRKGGGGGSSDDDTTSTTTNNIDSRAVLQDAVQVGAGANANITMVSSDGEVLKALAGRNADVMWMAGDALKSVNGQTAEVYRTLATGLPDAVKALGGAGATIIKDAGGAVVDLNRDSLAANTKAWDATVSKSAEIIDSLIDGMSESYGLAEKSINTGNKLAEAAVAAFTPTENKNADIGKYALFAAAAVAAVVLLKDK